jgi:superfamily II DNA or RNA helicase
MNEYEKFIESKKRNLLASGFDVEVSELNKNLFDFQQYVVKTAIKKGKYAIFADCGLGKTLMQLEFANQVSKKTQKPVLILCPLAVAGQTIQEGEKFEISVVKMPLGINSNDPVQITNYESLQYVDPDNFSGIILDESSILKNFEGKTRSAIIEAFKDTPYKLACTATPSPNDPMELGNHAEFLNTMSRNEMLAMYFVHDGGDTSKWRLKGHAAQPFWDWVSEWAVMFSKPSDIGFSADGYVLPNLNLLDRQIVTGGRNNGKLFNDVHVSATDFNAELRLTKVERLSEVVEIVNTSDENFIIWIKQDEEGDYLKKLIPDAIEVRGSHSQEFKEKHLLGFARGEFRVLITKTKIAQFGLNYQNCRNQVFASLDFSFEGLYQAIRRSYRFGQKSEVNIYMITTDTMQNVVQSIQRKQSQFEKMQASMSKSVNLNRVNKQKMERQFEEYKTENCTVQLGDCVKLIENVKDEAVGLTVFSPPFAELYTYSDQAEDMGNSKDYNEFLFAFSFLVKNLFRVTMTGRNVVVHCMDLPIQKGKEGVIALRDFSGMIIKAFSDAGFVYHSRVTLWKDPVTEMQRTKALGLLHKQIKKDAAMSRVGIPDYLLVFRKDGAAVSRVTHQDTDPSKPNYLPVNLWQKYASPVWMDIDYGDTLNVRQARAEEDEKHICPLQLGTIERAVHLWSNEGDLVLDPFGGIGSTGFKALQMKRRALMFELKKSYFDVNVKNCKAAEAKNSQAVLEFSF